VIERQVAGGLEKKGLQVVDRALGQGSTDPQVGVLQQVFGGAGVADHGLEGAQQGLALAQKQRLEAGLAHGTTEATGEGTDDAR
jgi:hypothetical protein